MKTWRLQERVKNKEFEFVNSTEQYGFNMLYMMRAINGKKTVDW
jgi:hypothetical protein